MTFGVSLKQTNVIYWGVTTNVKKRNFCQGFVILKFNRINLILTFQNQAPRSRALVSRQRDRSVN